MNMKHFHFHCKVRFCLFAGFFSVMLEQIPAKDLSYQEAAAEITANSSTSPASSANVDSLYQEALAAFAQKDWIQAVISLEKIRVSQPDYRDVIDRLVEARVNLIQAETFVPVAAFSQDGERALSRVAGALAFILFPLIGFFFFSPTSRARYHLWRNDHEAAAQIYEKMLVRHPNRVKHYPALANIYLRQDRRDERAMKVYKTVLQLNLATNDREEINSIVAMKYLTEGRTDVDAIEVLENELEAARRSLKHAT